METELITIREASKILGVSVDTLRRWDKAGKLVAVRAGNGAHRRYKRVDIDLLMNDLFTVAKSWVFSNFPGEPHQDFFCQNSSIFQARLGRMETELGHVQGISESYPLLVAITGEIGNNSFDHNLGNWPDTPGVFFAFNVKKRMIVLADRGQGVLVTLRRVRPNLSDHKEALEMAFTQQISGRAPEARGNGLKFVKQVVSENPFSLIFQTGNAKLEMKPNEKKIYVSSIEENFHGCMALIKF
ncbi:MAG: helix-turn-helix domain-containing protein [Candidatus Gracilibacteria bacterium]|jgi:excisionase family DNA binding protein